MNKNIKSYLINENNTIRQCIKQMNNTGNKILFCINNKKKITASITNGDIRRALFKDISMNTKIIEIANKNFKFVYNTQIITDTLELMEQYKIYNIPVLNKKHELVNVFSYNDFIEKFEHTPVLIFAGGKGKRLAPLTKYTPKPLLHIGTKSIIEMIIEKLIYERFYKIFISLNYKSDIIKKQILKHFPENFNNQSFILENKPLGTAGSLLKLKNHDFENIVTYNSDIVSDINMKMLLKHHIKNKNDITSVIIPYEQFTPFGIVTINKNRITKIEEKPKEIKYILAGINIINKSILNNYNKCKKIDMDELINNALNSNYKIGYYIHNGLWTDIGEIETYTKLNNIYGRII